MLQGDAHHGRILDRRPRLQRRQIQPLRAHERDRLYPGQIAPLNTHSRRLPREVVQDLNRLVGDPDLVGLGESNHYAEGVAIFRSEARPPGAGSSLSATQARRILDPLEECDEARAVSHVQKVLCTRRYRRNRCTNAVARSRRV